MILLKFTNYPFSSITFTTAFYDPIIITYVSLSLYSIVKPGFLIAFSQV